MPDSSGRPDLVVVAQDLAASYHPIIIGTGSPPAPDPITRYAAVYVQATAPPNPVIPSLWVLLDAAQAPTGEMQVFT